jgi:FtsP/CotA-like multicopper oxidase with cupredoxin domain
VIDDVIDERNRSMTHTRRFTLALLALALAFAATACSSGDEDGAQGTGDVAAGGDTSFHVTLSEFAITPDMIDAPAGSPLVFDIVNEGTAPHSFAVGTTGRVYETEQIQSGASATLRVDALDPGTYKVYCTVSGHEDLGMVGQLMVGGDASAGTAAPAAHASMSADEMAQSHKEGVEAFPAETKGTGNQPLEPTIEDGVKVFELTATEVEWESEPGRFFEGMAFNGQIPGPELRVEPGDDVRIVLNNQMSQPTTLHLHGVTLPNAADGVPYITQDPIMPGGYFVYDFTVTDSPGMYVYHSHFNSTEQVGKGLYGALIVEPKGNDWSKLYRVDVDVEADLFLGDGPLGYVLNGKGFPATQPIVAKEGDIVLIHIANDGSMIHPMHLHGYHFEVVSKDGFPLDETYMADTLMIAPGERFDVLVDARYPGTWAFHCHILPHVEGPAGMFGMVTALVVQ